MKIGQTISMGVIALLVVAMSAGMAAAATIAIAPNPIPNALNGTHVTSGTVTISNADIGSRSVVLDTSTADLQARLVGNGMDTGWVTSTTKTYDASASEHTFTLYVKGIASGRVAVADYKGTTVPSLMQFAECDVAYETVDVRIPEFATLAIPVVALLGLVLFMRRKKE
jgi:hypothetical protein